MTDVSKKQATQRALAWKLKLLLGAQQNLCKVEDHLPPNVLEALHELKLHAQRVESLVLREMANIGEGL